jgi:hypothetical protein
VGAATVGARAVGVGGVEDDILGQELAFLLFLPLDLLVALLTSFCGPVAFYDAVPTHIIVGRFRLSSSSRALFPPFVLAAAAATPSSGV